MPLNPATKLRNWEISREYVQISKVIGKGAFSQVAKALAWNINGIKGLTTVAVKMLKGMWIKVHKWVWITEAKPREGIIVNTKWSVFLNFCALRLARSIQIDCVILDFSYLAGRPVRPVSPAWKLIVITVAASVAAVLRTWLISIRSVLRNRYILHC